jgi:transcriptional regulator GlxA family with amidase domain
MISDTGRHVAFFVYPGFLLLDLSGPLDAFSTANELAPGAYRFSFMSIDGGEVRSSAGLCVSTEAGVAAGIDTFVLVGDPGLSDVEVPAETIGLIRTSALRARRTASVCMGAFLLAASGLLDGRRATTHWRFASRMKAMYPAVEVDGDRIYVNDGGVWTSAGMTAGIDLALALIEEDLGREVARRVAQMMVVYYHRPGGQLQHSSLLDVDLRSDRIREVVAYIRANLAEPLSVEQIAEIACLSIRQFSRAFTAATGLSPAKAVERLRAETARPRVEDGRETLEAIAAAVGFADAERMRRSFIRIFGQSPQAIRRAAHKKGFLPGGAERQPCTVSVPEALRPESGSTARNTEPRN